MYADEQFEHLEQEERDLTDEAIAAMILVLSSTKSNLERELRNFYQKYGKDGVITYSKWESGVQYEVGHRVRYNDILYRVLQAHTSQDNWTPDVAVSLFARVLIPDENVVSAWIQPDSTNPYMIGDKVSHNGKTWISDYNNNVWEPGVFGWHEI